MNLKTTLGLAISMIASSSLLANQLYLPQGTNLSTGGASNSRLGQSSLHNPAAIHYSTGRFGMNLIHVGVATDLAGGQALFNAADRLGDEFDSATAAFDNASSDVSGALDAAGSLEAALNQELGVISDGFFFQPGVHLNAPLLPIQFQAGNVGAFAVSLSSFTSGKIQLLHESLALDIDASALAGDDDINPLDFLTTASSLYTKGGQVFNASLGYARPVYDFELLNMNADVIVGGRVTLSAHSLQKNLYPVKGFINALVDEDEDLDAVIDKMQSDNLDHLSSYDLAMLLDVGAIVSLPRGHIGATFYNLNSPSYSFNELGGNCMALSDEAAQLECFHAEYFAARGYINLAEEHVVNPVLTLDGGYQLLNNQIALVTSLDMWSYNDLFGRKKQNANAAILLQPRWWYAPAARIGFNRNLADEPVTQYSLGLTFFNALHLDAAARVKLLDLFNPDESKQADALRGFALSAGLGFSF